MNRWFRFYEEVLNDPKAQRLSGDRFKAWVNLLCLASANNGAIMRCDVAFALRESEENAGIIVAALIEQNLLEDRGDCLAPHNWAKRQYKSDVTDPTAAARMERHRNKKRNDTVTVTDTRADTEQIRSENKRSVADATRPDAFDDFWKVYPKREGSNPKSPARKLFFQALKNGGDATAIIGSARRYAEECAKNKILGTPHVAQSKTWLYQRRWEDYPPTETTGFALSRETTRQWDAWRAYRIANGEDVKFMDAQREKGATWTVTSEWPPALPKAEDAA